MVVFMTIFLKQNEMAEGRLTEETCDTYRVDEVNSFVADGSTLIDSTKRAIKIWDLVSLELQRQIPVEEEYTLLSLEGNLLSGFAFNTGFSTLTVRIWNVFTGKVLHSEKLENKSAVGFPSVTLYKGTIYRIANEGAQHTDIDIRELISEADEQIHEDETLEEPLPRSGCTIF